MGLAATLWGVKKQSLAGLELLAAAPQPACAVPSRQCSGHGKGAWNGKEVWGAGGGLARADPQNRCNVEGLLHQVVLLICDHAVNGQLFKGPGMKGELCMSRCHHLHAELCIGDPPGFNMQQAIRGGLPGNVPSQLVAGSGQSGKEGHAILAIAGGLGYEHLFRGPAAVFDGLLQRFCIRSDRTHGLVRFAVDKGFGFDACPDG